MYGQIKVGRRYVYCHQRAHRGGDELRGEELDGGVVDVEGWVGMLGFEVLRDRGGFHNGGAVGERHGGDGERGERVGDAVGRDEVLEDRLDVRVLGPLRAVGEFLVVQVEAGWRARLLVVEWA
jgi:hypothetical protein